MSTTMEEKNYRQYQERNLINARFYIIGFFLIDFLVIPQGSIIITTQELLLVE